MKLLPFFAGLLCVAALGEEPPATMTVVSARLRHPEVPDQSFGAKPKVYFRAGTRYCRIEEEADPQNGIHGVMIINEPDVWMVNLLDKSAKHFVDTGPTFNC